MDQKREKKSISSIAFSIFKYIMLISGSLVAVIPVVVCVFTAFKTEEEYQSTSALTLPKSFLYFENFKVAFTQANMARGFLNTAMVLVVVLLASVLIGAMLAYVLNRFKFLGNGMIRNLFMFASRHCNAGNNLSDYEFPWVYQSSVWLYDLFDGNRYYFYLYLPSVF